MQPLKYATLAKDSVQFSCSVVSDSLRPHESQHARPPCPSPTPESTQTHVHWVGDAIQPSYSLSSPSPPTLNLSQHQGLFKWVSSSYQVAKVLEFQLQHQSFQWTPRTDLLWMDWLDLLAVQGTLKSFPQHHSSKVSIFWCSAFFIVQLSHPYMTTREGNGNPLQYSCLENPMDGGATVHGVAKSQTWLSDFTFKITVI